MLAAEAEAAGVGRSLVAVRVEVVLVGGGGAGNDEAGDVGSPAGAWRLRRDEAGGIRERGPSSREIAALLGR
jgi:hypothetical protein